MQSVQSVVRVSGSVNTGFVCEGPRSGVNDGGGSCVASAAPRVTGEKCSLSGLAGPSAADPSVAAWEFVEAVTRRLVPLAGPITHALMQAPSERVAHGVEDALFLATWMTVAHAARRRWAGDSICLWRGRVDCGYPLRTMRLLLTDGMRVLDDGQRPCVSSDLTAVRAAVVLAGLVDLLLRLSDGWSAAPLREDLLRVQARLADGIYLHALPRT